MAENKKERKQAKNVPVRQSLDEALRETYLHTKKTTMHRTVLPILYIDRFHHVQQYSLNFDFFYLKVVVYFLFVG